MKKIVVPSVGTTSLCSAVQIFLDWRVACEDLWEQGRYAQHNRLTLLSRNLAREIRGLVRGTKSMRSFSNAELRVLRTGGFI
jgi:hypothetical protein